MVVTRVLAAGAVLAALALILAAPSARADDDLARRDGNFARVNPAAARGGQSVLVEARCNATTVDMVVSGGLTDVQPFTRSAKRDVNIEAVARVRDDVQSADFAVSFHCGKQKITTKLTVVNEGGQPTTTAQQQTTTATFDPSATTTAVIPRGAPDTGGEPPSADDGSGLLGLAELGGLVMIAGAGVGVAVLSRRRRLSSEVG